jgi:acyl-CoA synthetase (AMP-forming)/AMP-acid ligase II
MTYAEMDAKVTAVGSALVGAGVAKGGAVGVYAANSPEWMITMKGIDRLGTRLFLNDFSEMCDGPPSIHEQHTFRLADS